MTSKPETLWIPNNNYFLARNGHNPRYVIVHGTAGFTSAEEVGHYFKATEGGGNPVSTHYIIGLHGEIVQCVDEKHGAYANGGVTVGHDFWWTRRLNPNLLTLSIEHVKLSRDNSDELTEKQKQASFALIDHICERHTIPRRWADDIGGVTGHYSMDPVHRSFCPGPYPWEELFEFLTRNR